MARVPGLAGAALLAVAAVGLGGCKTEPEAGGGSTAAAQAPGDAQTSAQPPGGIAGAAYTVEPARSEVFWRISKAGLLARAGHNHVISAETYTGNVVVAADDPVRSRFELTFPVADFVIDDPALRSRFGPDYASVPSESDIAGTRGNMLGDGLLKGAQFPVVRVSGGLSAPPAGAQVLPIEIEILGRKFALMVPGTVTIGERQVEASGEFTLGHAALGLEPFSALGGALQVGEDILFTYRIVATRDAAPQ